MDQPVVSLAAKPGSARPPTGPLTAARKYWRACVRLLTRGAVMQSSSRQSRRGSGVPHAAWTRCTAGRLPCTSAGENALHRGADVLIEVKEVGRIPGALCLDEPRVVVAVRRL